MDNQTDPKDLARITQNDRGIGLFLVPDVKNDTFGAAVKAQVPDITYSDCIRRGQFVIAFKWIPNSVMKTMNLTAIQLNAEVCGAPCVDSCVKKGCLCNRKTGFCQ